MFELTLLDDDRHIWEHELADFVPQRIFDGHSHLYDRRFLGDAEIPQTKVYRECPVFDLATLRAHSAALFPGRQMHLLITGNPRKGCDMTGMNEWVAQQLAGDSSVLGLMLVHPDMTVKEIEAQLDEHGWRGFKPYMCFAKREDFVQSTVLEMLPEHCWKIAEERKLVVLLHLGRHTAMADPENQRQVRDLSERYPNVRVQLAHCARCFAPAIAEVGLPAVADLPNCHVDTSAVCEAEVFHILFDVWPRERIIFGSDNPAGLARGKYVAFGRGWYGVYEDNTTAFQAPHVPFGPTYIAYENLCALRYAVRRRGWGKQEIEDLFWNNAVRLLDGT